MNRIVALFALTALVALSCAPHAAAGGVRVYDCSSYGPAMSCLKERTIAEIDSDLIPYDIIVCGEVFYPSASC